MTVSLRLIAAGCLAVLVSFGASAADQLSGSQIKGFISSFPELKAMADKRRIDFEKDRDRRRASAQGFSPFSEGITRLREAGAYGEANGIVRRHGFSSVEAWGGIADRILRAYIALSMQGQQGEMAAGMKDARSMIMNNPHMTEQQKAQALASINASMRSYKLIQEGNPADKAAILPYRAQLDALFDNQRANRGMNPGKAQPPGGTSPRPGQAATGSAAGAPSTGRPSGGSPGGIKARLGKLKELYDAGLINKQEYDAKRAAILSEL